MLALIEKRSGKDGEGLSDVDIRADVVVFKMTLSMCKDADKSFGNIFPTSLIENMAHFDEEDDYVNEHSDSGLSGLLMLLYIGSFSTMGTDTKNKRRLNSLTPWLCLLMTNNSCVASVPLDSGFLVPRNTRYVPFVC